MGNKEGQTLSLKDIGSMGMSENLLTTKKEDNVSAMTKEMEEKIEAQKITPKEPAHVHISAKDGEELTREMQKTMMSNTYTGFTPNFDDKDMKEIGNGLEECMNIQLSYDKEMEAEYVAILKKYGYTDEEITSMPYAKFVALAKAIRTDDAMGTIGDAAGSTSKVNEIDTTKRIVEVAETTNQGIVEKGEVNEKGEKVVTETIEKTETIVTTTDTIKKVEVDEPTPEPTFRDIIGDNKNIYIKYVDKPTNSYGRIKQNKSRKLLNRQKRGKMVEVLLPNSNIKLAVFELHQPNIIEDILSVQRISQAIFTRRRAVEAILERSTVIASDGDEITLDALLHYIANDDIQYLYLAAAAANSVDKIPHSVTCNECGMDNQIIGLDAGKLFVKSMQDLPEEVINNFSSSDDFITQISKSNANMDLVVYDDTARTSVTITNPSILATLKITEGTKSYICNKYAHIFGENLKYRSLDDKFDFVLSNRRYEIQKELTACILLNYIDTIRIHKFDTETDWKLEENIEEVYGKDEDDTELLVEALLSLESTTLDILEKSITEKFIKKKYEVTTGAWKCANEGCGAMNDTPVAGLEILSSSLYIKMQNNI